MEFRNVAIIAHVDHGKTTLVDGLLHQCHSFQDHERIDDRVMDSMDLERERGITISSKNTAVVYKGVKINIMDTPGHADFGGEVERVMKMVDGVILLVDASEGPLPQTRFVLGKAMAEGHKVVVVINKIDRPDARAEEVLNEVYDLFIDLGADDKQLEFPVLYAIARDGIAQTELNGDSKDLRPLLDSMINDIPPPTLPEDTDGPAQLLVTSLDYDPYVGRISLGRLFSGKLRRNQFATHFGEDGQRTVKLGLLYSWMGLKRHEVQFAEPGDIVAVAGIDGITVGDTLSTGEEPIVLPRLRIDEPTIGMTFSINTSPYAGQDGKMLTGRQIRERLERELMSNVSLRLDETESREAFKVYGRGELQLAILVEQMRREGFELSLSRPEVVKKEVDGKTLEPYEMAFIDVPDDHVGSITQMMASRKGEMSDLKTDGSGRSLMVYRVPSRGLIGFRSELMTTSRGEAVMNTQFDGWDTDAGYIPGRSRGTLVADRTGKTTAYALHKLQPRGELMVGSQVEVYEGMIVGIAARANDLNVDPTRPKQLNNIRSAGADEKLILTPPKVMSLEQAIEFIDDDEWVEVTPNNIRIRKKVLKSNLRTIRRGDTK
ncbi:MAG: GTP-binding protein [Myxococcota bacterium]|jgi:GTP-binding protein